MNAQAKNQSKTAGTSVDRETIAAMAYKIYLESGSKPGRDEENWLEAERRLAAQGARPNKLPLDPSSNSKSPQPLDPRENPQARDERGSASREEVRAVTSNLRNAPRASQRRPERSNQPR